MDYALLGRLREAKYKGIQIFVDNSNIIFGQKTVVNKFPNSNRTEVQSLGLNEDQFQLDIYVRGSGLLEKRDRLKSKLSEPTIGKLIHPYSGEINCKPISCELKDSNKELGICRFSVTFQQCSDPSYPSVSENTKPLILRAYDAIIDVVESGFDSLTNVFENNAIFTASKLDDVFDTFDNASRLTYKIADKANELRQGITSFKDKINNYATAPSTLGAAFSNLFSIFNFAASDNKTQFKICESMFNFGANDEDIPQDTMERIERKKVFKAINDCINVDSLAMAYSTASEIDYANDEEIALIRDSLEVQYEFLQENLSLELLSYLDNLRNNTLSFLDNLKLANVTESNVQPTSILLLAFNNYGDISRYDDLFYLNKPYDPAFIQGDVKILSE